MPIKACTCEFNLTIPEAVLPAHAKYGCVLTPKPWPKNSNAAEYQDKVYGKGMRVHTQSGEHGKKKFRCTVCGDIKHS